LSASCIAGLLLTAAAVVTEKPQPKGGAPAMPGGGGMGRHVLSGKASYRSP
jgi:chaperonin GroEL